MDRKNLTGNGLHYQTWTTRCKSKQIVHLLKTLPRALPRPMLKPWATCGAEPTFLVSMRFPKKKAFNEDPSQCLAVHHKQEWTTIKHIKLSEQMICPQQVDLVLDVWRNANFVCPRHPPSNPLRRLVRSRACRTPKRVSK